MRRDEVIGVGDAVMKLGGVVTKMVGVVIAFEKILNVNNLILCILRRNETYTLRGVTD